MTVITRVEGGVMPAASHRVLRIASHHHKLGKGEEVFSPESQEEHGLANTLISDF